MYRLMRPIYPGAIELFSHAHDEDDVLLRPRVSKHGKCYKAEARLSFSDPCSHYTAWFASWRAAMMWALNPGRMGCACVFHSHICVEIMIRSQR